mgnify:CR=1 FL=1
MKNKSVYLMQSGNKVKIGVSEIPTKRLNSLRIGCPDISLVYASDPISNAFEIESKLHSAFSEFSLGHEWFSAEIKEEAIVAIEEYVCSHGKLSKSEESNTDATDILSKLFSEEALIEDTENLKRERKAAEWILVELSSGKIPVSLVLGFMGLGYDCSKIKEICAKYDIHKA